MGQWDGGTVHGFDLEAQDISVGQGAGTSPTAPRRAATLSGFKIANALPVPTPLSPVD